MDDDPVFAEGERRMCMDVPIIDETENTGIFRFFKYHAWTHDPRPALLDLYHLKSPTLPFLLFPFQKKFVINLVNHIVEQKDIFNEKSRELGETWLVLVVILFFWLKREAGNDFLIGSRSEQLVDKRGAQDTLFEKIRYNLTRVHPVFLPEEFDSKKHDHNLLIINPYTQSFMKGESNNENFGTGGRYKAVFVDEFAKWNETDAQAWTSLQATTRCRIVVSTPVGVGNKFADLRFSDSIDVYTVHWSDHPLKNEGLYRVKDGQVEIIDKEWHQNHPGYGFVHQFGYCDGLHSPWYDTECRRADDPLAEISQELDIAYLTSGHPYFDNDLISRRYRELSEIKIKTENFSFERVGQNEIKFIPDEYGPIRIYKKAPEVNPYEKFRYCISADVASGSEHGDWDSAYVYDRVTGEDVAEFHGHATTDMFALVLFKLSKLYQNAHIAPENNNEGHAVVQKLKELKAPMMFERDFTERIDYDTDKLGWNTSVVSRPVMLAVLREAINTKKDGIFDREFFSEALTFILLNGKHQAAGGKNDDRVIAQAIKFQIHNWLPAPKKKEIKERPGVDYFYKRGTMQKSRPKGAAGV